MANLQRLTANKKKADIVLLILRQILTVIDPSLQNDLIPIYLQW